MATPQMPSLFLSHSGKQKDFTRRLYRELLHVNHNPFFDQDARDSLPKGTPFPSRIVEACCACKLGIVVLSHEYIESLWPMLELQHLIFHDPYSPTYKVYPIFYKLKPKDLSDEGNLKRWQSKWDEYAPSWHAKMEDLHMAAPSGSPLQPTLDISLWPRALAILRSQSGSEVLDNQNEHAFIQVIVSNICYRFPPPVSLFMGHYFKGAERMQQEIHMLFQQQQQQRDEENDYPRELPLAIGVHGMGGSGKTTLCKYMLNFYNKEYPGSCCFLQFSNREEDESQLVQMVKEVLSEQGNWAKELLDKINGIEKAMHHLQELLKRYRVFLVLDNVWDWALQRAEQIVTMDYMPGSRLLVTTRSPGVLQCLSSSRESHVNKARGRLLAMQIVHVPSISEEEAVDALMAYSFSSNPEDLRSLARSCFIGKQCHPLLLKDMGGKLRRRGNTQSVLSSYPQAHCLIHAKLEEKEEMVLNVLKESLNALSLELQNTFLHLGSCVPKRQFRNSRPFVDEIIEWLSKLSRHTEDMIRDQLVELEYHGLIQIDTKDVVIHDLHMMLIENIVQEKSGAPRCFLFEGDLETLSTRLEWRRPLKYICGSLKGSSNFTVLSPDQRSWLDHISGLLPFVRFSPNCPDIEVLELTCAELFMSETFYEMAHVQFIRQRLCVKYMQSLRHLKLAHFHILKEVGGWHGAPNLVSVKLIYCKNLQKIESMACLCKLESLVIKTGDSSGQNYVTHLSSSSSEHLKRLVNRHNLRLKHLKSLGHDLPKLQELDLRGCKNLVDVGSLAASTSLQRCCLQNTGILKFPEVKAISLGKLDLWSCYRLQSIEGSVGGLTALEVLNLNECKMLESVLDLEASVKLRILRLWGCPHLKEVKLGEAALTSLEELDIQYSCLVLSCSPLPISAFTNLRKLWAAGGSWGSSIQVLELAHLKSAHEIDNLIIEGWPLLTKITGLGHLTKLESFSVRWCSSLRELGHWEDPSISNLKYVDLSFCPKLETPSKITHLSSLMEISITSCPMVNSSIRYTPMVWNMY